MSFPNDRNSRRKNYHLNADTKRMKKKWKLPKSDIYFTSKSSCPQENLATFVNTVSAYIKDDKQRIETKFCLGCKTREENKISLLS